jgi:hypothetical protein
LSRARPGNRTGTRRGMRRRGQSASSPVAAPDWGWSAQASSGTIRPTALRRRPDGSAATGGRTHAPADPLPPRAELLSFTMIDIRPGTPDWSFGRIARRPAPVQAELPSGPGRPLMIRAEAVVIRAPAITPAPSRFRQTRRGRDDSLRIGSSDVAGRDHAPGPAPSPRRPPDWASRPARSGDQSAKMGT